MLCRLNFCILAFFLDNKYDFVPIMERCSAYIVIFQQTRSLRLKFLTIRASTVQYFRLLCWWLSEPADGILDILGWHFK